MKKFSIAAGILCIIMSVSTPVFAMELPNISGESVAEQKLTQYYGSYSGTVDAIYEFEDRVVYTVKKDGEIVADITLVDNTYVVGERDIKEGDTIEGFYYMLSPMLMIYPPRITADVITVNFPDAHTITVNKFDDNLVSADNELKLNISEDTEIVLQDGTAYDGELTNRNLAVIYSITTRSIPAQTSPSKVIVLFEKITPAETPSVLPPELIEEAGDGENSSIILENLNGEIVVDDVIINAPRPYLGENGAVMVPLRAVAEALNYDVSWDDNERTVWLNNIISLSIGKDYYTFARMAPISLGVAPELRQDSTFVPLSFFKDVARINNAYVLEGQVVIDNKEIIE